MFVVLVLDLHSKRIAKVLTYQMALKKGKKPLFSKVIVYCMYIVKLLVFSKLDNTIRILSPISKFKGSVI